MSKKKQEPEDLIEWVEIRPHEFVAKCELMIKCDYHFDRKRKHPNANLIGQGD